MQASGGQTAQDIALCEDEGVTCEVADPSTTRGEVLLMSEQARAEAPSVIVVTTTPHVARTRYIFGKCYPGEVHGGRRRAAGLAVGVDLGSTCTSRSRS